ASACVSKPSRNWIMPHRTTIVSWNGPKRCAPMISATSTVLAMDAPARKKAKCRYDAQNSRAHGDWNGSDAEADEESLRERRASFRRHDASVARRARRRSLRLGGS